MSRVFDVPGIKLERSPIQCIDTKGSTASKEKEAFCRESPLASILPCQVVMLLQEKRERESSFPALSEWDLRLFVCFLEAQRELGVRSGTM